MVVGDATKRKVLQSLGIEDFHTMAVLADHTSEESVRYSDHRSLMIALAASSLNPELHIVAEVVSSENREHFERIPDIEIVSVQELSEKLLAQAVISPGVMEVFSRLLTATADSNEIYIVPIPEKWQGKTFQEIYLSSLDEEKPFIPLGYTSSTPDSGETIVVLNPRTESSVDRGVVRWRHQPLTTKDSLVLVAFEEPEF
jgi:Trk K+ transport system NAD-binding subunit